MITYGFFNSVSGDRKYNADQMSEYFSGLIANGVYEAVGDKLQVVAGTGMTVNVKSGRAMIDCKWMENNALYPVEITAANGLNPRWTAVIVSLDADDRLMEITTKDGTPASTPVKPSISANELCLAMVYVAAGATSISQSAITDTRADTDVCGWVTGLIDQVDTSDLWAQWQAAYAEYFREMANGFEQWFADLTSTLNVNTYVASYRKQATLAGSSTEIELDMTGYIYDPSDIIMVYVNGLLGVPGTDYSVDSDTGAVTPTATKSGTIIDIVVLKSKIGFFIAATSLGDALSISNGDAIML